MGPPVDGMTSPALLPGDRLAGFSLWEMGALDSGPKLLGIVGSRCPVAPVALPCLCRGMSESLHLPGGDPMTFPAVLPKQPMMPCQMTLGTLQLSIEQGVVHLRDIRVDTPMFRMTFPAEFFRFMKTNPGGQSGHVAEFMTAQTLVIGDALPGDMAVVTC